MKRYLKPLLITGGICAVAGGLLAFGYCSLFECKVEELIVTSYEDCIEQGFPVENSNPPKCIVSRDKVFIKAPENVRVSEPVAKALVTSPLTIRGEALALNNTVYYRLLGEDKSVLAEGSTKTDSEEHGRFGAYSFSVSFDDKDLGSGTVEVFEKNPSGQERGLVKIPVTFEAEAQRGESTAFEPLAALTDAPPAEANIPIPFTPQAPFADWSDTYNEACEEASLIMVEYLYREKELTPNLANAEIITLIDWETRNNYDVDVTAEELATIARTHYERLAKVYTDDDVTLENIKKLIAAGYPVIIPAAGQILGNPHYRGDGPPFHMLVISGYDAQGFIVQDPGTRSGKNYHYSYDTIMNAIHDWTGSKSTIRSGQKAIIIIGK